MPGFDRTGPLGDGPRTGRGLGLCRRAADRAAIAADSYLGQEAGWQGRHWGGGRRFGNRGRGRGWGFGMGWRASRDLPDSDVTPRRRQALLRRRIRELTAQLDQLNQTLSSDPAGGSQDQE